MRSKTRCSQRGKGSAASRSALRSEPGSTGSPPTGASTTVARPADDRPESGTSPEFSLPSPLDSAKPCGSSHFRTPSLLARSTRHLAPRRYERTESISLAFIAAIQALPPRQLAVLILRDVLGFHAAEVADILDSSLESVNSALKRARANLQNRWSLADSREPPPASSSPSEGALLTRFVSAYESDDLGALVAVLTDDVFMSMPPMSLEYVGRDLVTQFCSLIFGSGRQFDLIETRANGQPAFGAYVRTSAGLRHATGLFVLTLSGDQICAMTRFETSVLPWFGLPEALPGPS